MPDFKKLKEHVDRLSKLLDEPQEGLSSWCLMVGSEWQHISAMWTGPSNKPVHIDHKATKQPCD